MAQTILLPTTASLGSYPNSPDPTPLRLLAFSVAEAALMPDPNSPSFGFNFAAMPSQEDIEVATGKLRELNAAGTGKVPPSRWSSEFDQIKSRVPWQSGEPKATIASRRGKPLWDVVERAKERREREKSSPSSIDSPLPQSPISPTSYNFVLPAHSPLAASIANKSSHIDLNLDSPSYKSKSPGLTLSPSNRLPFPLFTRSAEPSPTKSVFSNLDRNCPPPEFVPRLSAEDFSQKSEEIASAIIKNKPKGTHGRTKSQSLDGSPTEENEMVSPSQRLWAQSRLNMPSKLVSKNKLPSLAELQAKLNRVQVGRTGSGTVAKASGHRRVTSMDYVHVKLPLPRPAAPARIDSDSSVNGDTEIIQTPTEEIKRNPHIVYNGMGGRPATPPTPTKETKEPRLAPFLRQRTSGRLIASARPTQSPEKTHPEVPAPQPVLRVIPPTLDPAPRVNLTQTPSGSPTARAFPRTPIRSITLPSPTQRTFNHHLSTPPTSSSRSSQQASPTGSYRSSSASPTLSVPIITCTPAPTDGCDSDGASDSGSEEDVVVFDSEVEEAKEREERERRGREMRNLLGARRRSSE